MAREDISRKLIRNASVMGAATFLSRILGLVREQVFAYMFGAGHATDAYQIAFRIPNLLRDLFAEGAMSNALVPTFVRTQREQGDARAWRLAGLVFRVLFCFVSVLTLIGIIFADRLVGLYASSFKEIPGKFELTVQMTQIMFPFFPLIALAAAYMAVLNARERFFVPAFASALFNLSSILSGVAFAWALPHLSDRFTAIEGMAWGVVIGGLAQAFSQLPTLYRSGYRWMGRQPGDLPWYQDSGLRQMILLMGPGTLALASTQVNVLINSVLATQQGEGAVSWLNYAFRLMQFPIGVFGVSIATATLKLVSESWVEKKWEDTAQTLSKSLSQVFFINLPASAGLIALGEPIIRMLFEHGRFSPEDTRATANALAGYAIGLTAYSVVKVLVPACYAVKRTRVAIWSSILSVIFTLTANIALVKSYGYFGLAVGTSVAAFLNAGFLIGALHLALKEQGTRLPFGEIAKNLIIHLGLASWVGGLAYGTYRLMWQILGHGLWVLDVFIPIGIAVLGWIVALKATGLWTADSELSRMFHRIKSRLGFG